jgi:hypothetical protein
MNHVPLFVLALLLGGATLLPAVQRWWPARMPQVAFLTAATTSLVWLLAAGFLPLSLTFSEWPVALSLLPWQGLVDEVAWLLSALWLLLLAAALLVHAATSLAPEAHRQDANGQPVTGERLLWPALEPVRPALQPALLLLLGATGLIAVWSNSLAGILTGWTLLAAIWILLLLLATPLKESRHGSGEPPGHLLVRLGAGLSAPVFLWLAAAALPAAVNGGGLLSEIGQWPLWASAWLLLAAVWQMGIFPLHLWRPLNWRLSPYTAALIHTAPALAGLSLLIRLVTATDVALSFGLPLTAIGLLGLLAGAAMSWSVTGERLRVVAALALAHASLVLLVGMWTGGQALLVEARVLLIGIGLLFLSAGAKNEPRPAWYVVGPLLAAASLAGLPLTAGFTGRAALYNAWLDDGRFVLVLVSVLLHIPLLATAFYIAWRSRPGDVSGGITPVSLNLGLLPKEMALPEREKWPGLLAAVALLLPAITLITPSRLAFAEVRFVTWLAILAPVAAGAVLLRYLPLLREGQLALRQVVDLDLPLGWLYETVGRALAAAGSALREAAAILEGEGGMLWLVVLLVILWLAWLG